MAKFMNDQGLEEAVLGSNGFLVVFFYEAGSIPCGYFLPEFETVAEELKDRADFVKVDALENPTITADCGVEAVPTTLVFKDGDEVARYEGPYSREALGGRLAGLIK